MNVYAHDMHRDLPLCHCFENNKGNSSVRRKRMRDGDVRGMADVSREFFD
jgi:hypothetical protein